ncbi:hypothetical protein SCHPADRAFT_897779 [Schizopora paradoxa]|uniref:SET domain-containing protein n=1 Tax=Schizopora paradoxa TaxID=27342 RepID=A0A0H2STQ9_9AGAM|nr:hypothetical protein SCHPADRAFT_897779 [Schizopora paradoxa]
MSGSRSTNSRSLRTDKHTNSLLPIPSSSRNRRVPSRWPRDVTFLAALQYSPSIPHDVLALLRGTGSTRSSATANAGSRANVTSPTPVAIRLIDSPSHPAHGQMGLFANKKIPPHTHIIDYLGEVHTDDRPKSNYDLSLYRSQDGLINVGIDASCMGNEARFVNDYRGIKAKPNAMFKDSTISSQGELGMAVWSGCQAISKGEEILVSYGKSWWNARH